MEACESGEGLAEIQETEKFVAISWNACGMEEGAVHDLVMQMGSVHWDAIMLQEGPYAESNTYTVIEGGHALFLSESGANKRSVGLLLNRRWVQPDTKLSFHSSGQRVAYAFLDNGSLHLCLISAHLTHSGYEDEQYEAALTVVEEVVRIGRKDRRLNLLGIDANAVIGTRCLQDDGQIVGNHGQEPRNLRGDIFVSWLHGVRLGAVTTMKQKSWNQLWTHQSWSDKHQRQIDFILMDEVRNNETTDYGILDFLDGKSDTGPAI
jgi:hypothetical protein